VPFISVDTKKKELVGTFKNAGVEWQPKDAPELIDVHDFPSDALGKAIPYGVYDVADNSGFVNVGTDHDTPTFAVVSIEAWWKLMGCKRYPNATELEHTAMDITTVRWLLHMLAPRVARSVTTVARGRPRSARPTAGMSTPSACAYRRRVDHSVPHATLGDTQIRSRSLTGVSARSPHIVIAIAIATRL